MRKELKYFFLLKILPPAIALILKCIKLTARIQHINSEMAREGWKQGENYLFCFWHGRLLMMPFAQGEKEGKVLISRHRDGELIARIVRYFRIGTVRGSHRKGSIGSLREILKDLENGINIAITPDGPKGPRYVVKQGIVELAKLTGKGIVPISYSARKKKLSGHGTALFFPILSQRLSFSGVNRSL